jgi:hypothetical protein
MRRGRFSDELANQETLSKQVYSVDPQAWAPGPQLANVELSLS